MAVVYSYVVRVPKWLMYTMSGGLATFLINFLHREKPKAPTKSTTTKPSGVPKQAPSPSPATSATVIPKAEAKTTATSGQKTPSKRRGKK